MRSLKTDISWQGCGLPKAEKPGVWVSQRNQPEGRARAKAQRRKGQCTFLFVLEIQVPFWVPVLISGFCFVCCAWVLLGTSPNSASRFRTKVLLGSCQPQSHPQTAEILPPYPRTCSPANWLSQVMLISTILVCYENKSHNVCKLSSVMPDECFFHSPLSSVLCYCVLLPPSPSTRTQTDEVLSWNTSHFPLAFSLLPVLCIEQYWYLHGQRALLLCRRLRLSGGRISFPVLAPPRLQLPEDLSWNRILGTLSVEKRKLGETELFFNIWRPDSSTSN